MRGRKQRMHVLRRRRPTAASHLLLRSKLLGCGKTWLGVLCNTTVTISSIALSEKPSTSETPCSRSLPNHCAPPKLVSCLHE